MQTSLSDTSNKLDEYCALDLSTRGPSYSYVYIKLLRIYIQQGGVPTTKQWYAAKAAVKKIGDKEDENLDVNDLSFIDSRQKALEHAEKVAKEQDRDASLQSSKTNLLKSGLNFIVTLSGWHYGDKVLDAVDDVAARVVESLGRIDTPSNPIEDTFGGEVSIPKNEE